MVDGSLQLFPADWVRPLDVAGCYGRDTGPLEVDLGCGKGRFLLARAAAHPETAFLGVELKAGRVEKVERKARKAGLSNVRLLHADACYAVSYLLPPASVAVYYLFFPDPWPKRRHHRRRLFDPVFLDALDRTLVPEGRLHVATDFPDYYEAIRNTLARDARFDAVPPFTPCGEEQTDFERLFLGQGKTIGRASFRKRPRG